MSGALPMTLWLPPAIALGGIVLGMLADAFSRRAAALVLEAAGLLAAAVAGFVLAAQTDVTAIRGLAAYGAGFTSVPALGYALSAVILVSSLPRLAERDRGPAIGAIVGLGAIFSHALLASFDLVVLVVSLAGLSLAGYSLVAGAGTRRAEESAVRYFVQGAVATGLTLYGVGLVFALGGGQTDYLEVAAGLSAVTGRPALLALGLVVSAFAFKLGAFPFHSWAPDAFETADPGVAGFLASVPKLGAIVALLVLVRGTLFESPTFAAATNLLVALGIGSLAFGAFGMVRQRSAGRLLGYSGIAQVGYALLAIASGDQGVRATVVFAVTYAVGAAAAFAALEAAQRVMPEWDGTLAGMGGLSRRSPLTAASLAIAALSLTGIPLFAGFWGKLNVFVSLASAESVWLAIVAGVAAVVSFGGYGRLIRAAYFGEDPEGDDAEALREPEATEQGSADADAPELDDGPEDVGSRISTGAAVVAAIGVLALGILPLVLGISRVYALFNL